MLNYRAAFDLDEETGLPGAIQDELMNCPQTGTGERLVFRWLFKMAKRLQIYCDAQRFAELILEYSAGCGREVMPEEIADAWEAAADIRQHDSAAEYTNSAKRPKKTLEDQRAALLERVSCLQEGIAFREAQLVWLDGRSHRQIEDRPWVVSEKDTRAVSQEHQKLLAEAQDGLRAIEWLSLPPAERFPTYAQAVLECPEATQIVADWRGISAGLFVWLAQHGYFGIAADSRLKNAGGTWNQLTAVFPVCDAAGVLVGLHHRVVPRWEGMCINVPWFYDPAGTKPTPLVIGDPVNADLVIISESSWDPLAYADCYQLDQQQEVSWAAIITRGSANGARVPANFKDGAAVVILAQNDDANDDWRAALPISIREQATIIRAPAEQKDFNDWLRAVGGEEIRKIL
jgi:hypothetical protein